MAPKKGDIANTPDPFREFVAKIEGYLFAHKLQVYVVAGIIALSVLSYAAWYLYSNNYENNARLLYDRAVSVGFKGSSGQQDAIKIHKEVLAKYPRSKAAILSAYLLGNLFYTMNDMDAAIAAYKECLQKISPDYLLSPLVYTGLGYCYEAKKDYQSALTAYNNALKDPKHNAFLGIAYRNVGRAYEMLNNPVKAKEYYRKALGVTTDPSRALMLRRKL